MVKRLSLCMFILTLIFTISCEGGTGNREAAVFTSTASNANDYLSYLPEETNIVFYANLNSLRQSPFGEDLNEELEDRIRVEREDREYRDFVRYTGLDPKKDISEIMFGSNGRHREEQLGGAIIRGQFDEKRIIDYLKEERYHRFRERKYKGHTIYPLDDRGRWRDHDDNEFVFLNKEIVALGDRYWIEDVIDLKEDGGKTIKDNAVMVNFINDVPRKDQLWAVMNLEEVSDEWADHIRRSGSNFKGTQSIENMKSMIFYADVQQKANLNFKGNFETVEEAELLAETLNGFKAMAKLMVMDDREAIDMLNEIKIGSRGAELRLTTTVDKDFLHKIEEKRHKYRDRGIELP